MPLIILQLISWEVDLMGVDLVVDLVGRTPFYRVVSNFSIFLQMMMMMMVVMTPVYYPDAQAPSAWRRHLVACTTSVAKPMQWSTLLCTASVSFTDYTSVCKTMVDDEH